MTELISKESRNWILFNSCHLDLNHLIRERWWLMQRQDDSKDNAFQNIYTNFCICSNVCLYPRRFYLTGDMTNFDLFIQGSLEWPFSEVFFFDVSLWSQYKYIAFNIFTCKTLIISYKMLIITRISNGATNKIIIHANIMSKRHNILPTRTGFFISSAGKIESVQELKVKLFE